MVKKRVSKREIVEKHTRVRQHRNVTKLKPTIIFTETEEVSEAVEEIIEKKEEKHTSKRSKKAKTEEIKSE